MTDYAALLRELAVPRRAGTPSHTRVREALKRELLRRGFSVEEHAFSGRPARALLGTPRLISGINLIGRHGGAASRPTVWLVAHYDSKGQPISMAVRLLGVALLVVGVAGLAVSPWAACVAVLGVVILTQNRITDNSPGAVDNATALITIFMTLDEVAGPEMGVIFPDAEEYGLVGARALARERGELLANAAVVNLDGIDDDGRPVLFMHRRGRIGRAVADALGAAAWRWLPVVVDGLVLARAARECVTVLKGTWRTMQVVHRPSDAASRLSLRGARAVAAGLARALHRP